MKKLRDYYGRIPFVILPKKTIRVMKLTLFISLLTISQLWATETYSQMTKISLKNEDVKISEVLKEIENQSEFFFLYSPKLIDVERKVSIDVKKESIGEILNEIFDKSVKFAVYDRQIILSPVEQSDVILKSQQQNRISGIVTDNKGVPLTGVNVIVPGTTLGVMSDIDGKYSIAVPPETKTLQFSFIGMEPQEVTIGTQTQINVTLLESSIGLDEVIVVGYGTQKKINLTGAITQVTAEEFQDRPVTQMTQALQGVIPNLNVVFGSGKPGQSGALNIRGNTSINGGSPLVLIDGVPGNIDRINVYDVESVSVLKDASASAIYGARAAFGVILVTTKNPALGKPTISYSNNFGWTTFATNTDFITSGYWSAKINDDAMYNALGNTNTRYSTEDYDELLARINDKTENPDRPWVVVKPNSSGVDMYRYYGNFDWFNYLFKKWRPKQEHTVGISGSTDKIRYMISGTKADEGGIWKIGPESDNYQRLNFRTKIDADITKWFRISNSTRFFKSNYSWYGLRDNFATVTNDVTPNAYYHFMSAYVPHNPDGTLTGYTGINSYSIGYGMHAIIENGKSKGENNISDLESTFEANFKILKDWTVTANYTFQQENLSDYYRSVRVQYSKYPGVMETFALANLNKDQLDESTQNNYYHVINIFSNYQKTFGDHNFKGMVGYNQELRTFKTISGSGSELLSESLNDLNFVTGTNIVSGGASEWALRGAFYRFNYDYKGKYLLETSARYDGTSRFPQKDRFGFFPSFSLGWRMSEEGFFEPLRKVVNNVKLRYSYGMLGNQDVSTYAYISSMSTAKINYLVNGQQLNVVNNPSPVAASLTWEKTITNNIGFDADFFQQRLTLTIDAYIRDTKDMLTLGKTLPSVFGASEPKENAADLRTLGYEIAIGWRDEFQLAGKPFTFNVKAVMSDYTSKITKFDNPSNLLSTYYVGQKMGEIWGYSYDGYFKTTEEAQAYALIVNQDKINRRRVQSPTAELKLLQAGDIKILDLDGSGIIDVGANTLDDPGDRRIIGNSQPRYSYGLSLSGAWRNIGISAFFQGIGKQNWYPGLEAQQFWGPYARPYGSFLPENFQNMIWSTDNPNSYFPRMIGYAAQNSELSVANDMYLQDLSYCKLKNITIDYNLPSKFLSKIHVQSCKLYVSGENLITWTKLKTDYIDPEETMTDPMARTYPVGRTISAGFEITF
jgi:TonB-linked SusC/RagA family outer membrane protein